MLRTSSVLFGVAVVAAIVAVMSVSAAPQAPAEKPEPVWILHTQTRKITHKWLPNFTMVHKRLIPTHILHVHIVVRVPVRGERRRKESVLRQEWGGRCPGQGSCPNAIHRDLKIAKNHQSMYRNIYRSLANIRCGCPTAVWWPSSTTWRRRADSCRRSPLPRTPIRCPVKAQQMWGAHSQGIYAPETKMMPESLFETTLHGTEHANYQDSLISRLSLIWTYFQFTPKPRTSIPSHPSSTIYIVTMMLS